jgi:hypothetical protein
MPTRMRQDARSRHDRPSDRGGSNDRTRLRCIGTGFCPWLRADAGVFFPFASFVMPALARLPAAHGIAAMNSINVLAVTPVFMTRSLAPPPHAVF